LASSSHLASGLHLVTAAFLPKSHLASASWFSFIIIDLAPGLHLVGAWFSFIVVIIVIIDSAPSSHLAGASWFGFIVIIDPAPSVIVVAQLAYIVGERI